MLRRYDKTDRALAIVAGLAALLLGTSASHPAGAAELARLRADLTGAGKPQTVHLIAHHAADPSRARLLVRIGRLRYRTAYFRYDAQAPALRSVALDQAGPQRQLLLFTPEAGGCVYHLLGVMKGGLQPLWRQDAAPVCEAPRFPGDGTLHITSWQGFWKRDDAYAPAGAAGTLSRVRGRQHALRIDGIAGQDMQLAGAQCPAQMVRAGSAITVAGYDDATDRYLLEAPGAACGWVPASHITSLSGLIKGLPWAG